MCVCACVRACVRILCQLITYVSMVPHVPEHGISLVGYYAHFINRNIFYFSLFSILLEIVLLEIIYQPTMQIMVELSIPFSNLFHLIYFGTGLKK